MCFSPYKVWLLVAVLALGCTAGRGGDSILPDPDAGDPDVPAGGEDRPFVVDDRLPGGDSGACGSPRRMCGSSCIDVSVDFNNCGACAMRCGTGQSCTQGVCMGGGPCAPPRTMCDVCTDIQTDNNNCGLCGFRCPMGEGCAMGICRPGVVGGCASPRRMCGASCVDVSSDSSNCGACATRCLSGQVCSASRCTPGSSATSPAGAPCTAGGTECGAVLECQAVGARGFCTAQCDDGTVAMEQAQCGGRGSTCLTQGEGMTARSFCAHACVPTARSEATGGCRAGTVCTGWWYTHAMGADDPGCFPFCGADSDCAGMTPRCNTRTGSCGSTGVDTARLPDGSACNPMTTVMIPGEMTPRNVQCRGICFGLSSTNRAQGMCGSFLNMGASGSVGCPDSPMVIQPRVPMGDDNLGICIFRSCMRNSECGAGLLCIYPEQMGMPVMTVDRICNYATMAQRTGVP